MKNVAHVPSGRGVPGQYGGPATAGIGCFSLRRGFVVAFAMRHPIANWWTTWDFSRAAFSQPAYACKNSGRLGVGRAHGTRWPVCMEAGNTML